MKSRTTNNLKLKSFLFFAGIALTCTLPGCASYHLGNQFLYRGDIRTVHVVPFESDSFRRFLGQQLTETVIKEIEQQTPLTISEPQISDSFIRGRIVRVTKQPIGENRFDEARTLKAHWTVEIDWVDRIGTPLMQRQTISINESDDFIPESGQSLTTANQDLMQRIARQIVSQMQSPW